MRSRDLKAKKVQANHAGPQNLFYNTAIFQASRERFGKCLGWAFREVEIAEGSARSVVIEKSAGQRRAASDMNQWRRNQFLRGIHEKAVLILFAALAMISALAADTTVGGYLVDIACGTAEGSRPDFGIKHSKECLKMPDCAQSGYGVLTADKKVIKFDAAGNEQAKKFIADLKKSDDIKVSVTGAVKGDSMTVSKIELQ
jgi:hypothetical protein